MPTNAIIKIGVVVARTGPAGLLGNSFVKAIELANESLQWKGTKRQYEALIEDAGANPEQPKNVIEKLIKVDKVDALVVGLSASGKIVKPYATAAKIPLLCVCSIGDVGDGLYTFTTMPLAEDEATRWVAEAKSRGIKRIAVLTQEYPSVNNHVRAVKEEAAKFGITFAYENRFDWATTDFTSRIAAAKATSPDVYYIEAFNPAMDILGQQLRDSGVGNLSTVVAFSLSEKPELYEGCWYTDSYVSPQFKSWLDQKYPGTRLVTHMMPYGYDSFNMLVQGFESGQDVITYLRGMTEYAGTAGRMTREAGSGNFRSAPAVWMIKNGKPALAQ